MLRGSLMYLAIFVLLRIMLRRQAGGIGTSDVLVIVLIAEVAGNGIAPNDESVIEGVVLAFALVGFRKAFKGRFHRALCHEW